MKTFQISFFIFLFFFLVVSGQKNDLFLPLNFSSAFENNTRSEDGNPGENYWQNSAKYKINIEFFPEDAYLKGNAKITYTNNSPDTLTSLVIRFYQDLYKAGEMKDFNIEASDLHNGTKVTKMEINNIDLLQKKKVFALGTNKIVTLPEKVVPNSSVTLNIDWEFPLPKTSKIRQGVYPDSSYFIAYWYPQISVYDDIDGWDKFSYGGMQEFYGDFSDFDVEITVPKDYIVWATGELQNPKQVLNEKIYSRYEEAKNADKIVNIITRDDIYNTTLTADKKSLKWRFKADNVTDFAFGTSKYYLWDGVAYKSDKLPTKKVFISAAYNEKSSDFYEVASVAKSSIQYYSEKLPHVPFPYPSLTVFNGSGGMEFPMIVNDGSSSSRKGMVSVTAHEIAHTYFPFMTGINEKKYAWMDEGWAVFIPIEIQHELENSFIPMGEALERYEEFAGKDVEVPPMISTITLGGNTYRSTYRTASYYRSAIAYSILKNALGEDLFKKCLIEYINRWESKHPIPFDFFNTFNDVSKMDLNWFWKAWFYEFGYPDLKISSVQHNENNYSIEIEKTGNLPVPIVVTITDTDGQEYVKELNVNCWKNGETKQILTFENIKNAKNIVLGNSNIPDINKKNNNWDL